MKNLTLNSTTSTQLDEENHATHHQTQLTKDGIRIVRGLLEDYQSCPSELHLRNDGTCESQLHM